MKLLVVFALLVLAFDVVPARAQGWAARVLGPAPGQVWTVATGAGEPYAAGYGAKPGYSASGQSRAVLFDAGTFLDVTPSGRAGALINDSFGHQHGGGATAGADAGEVGHAFLWIDTMPVDLHPDGYDASEVLGVGGGLQAGYVVRSFSCAECGRAVGKHAALWNGSAESVGLLHAPAHDACVAWDTDGAQQVGQGQRVADGALHALLWNGPDGAAIDLHPAGAYDQSLAVDVSAGTQAGGVFGGATDFNFHAALWTGTAESFRDLNPDGYAQSSVRAVREGLTVGSGSTLLHPWRYRALAWRGSAESVVDLHAALPLEFQSWNSSAEAIDERGNIVGVVELSGDIRPVVWSTHAGGGSVAGAEELPVGFSLGRAVPNPAASSVRFRVGLPTAATVELALYDVRGARIRAEAKHLDAGWQTWAWDGVDDAGRPVASGVYFARLSVAGREHGTHKVVVTR
jgi:hypothetical protein